MKTIKGIIIFLLAVEIGFITVVLSLDGVHYNNELLQGKEVVAETVFTKKGKTIDASGQKCVYTGKYLYHFKGDSYEFEVKMGDKFYWYHPSTDWNGDEYLLFNTEKSAWGYHYEFKSDIHTVSTKLGVALRVLLSWIILSPVIFFVIKTNRKKILITLLIILSVIFAVMLIRVVLNMFPEFGWLIVVFIIIGFISEFFIVII